MSFMSFFTTIGEATRLVHGAAWHLQGLQVNYESPEIFIAPSLNPACYDY